jgi:hypothetical protein
MRKGKSAGFGESYLVNDFESLNFPHSETPRTDDKRAPGQSGIIGVTVAKQGSGTIGMCIPIIVNMNIPKM